MNATCPICKFTNESSSTACAKCGNPLGASVSPRNYLNDAGYDSPLLRRIERESLEGRVTTAFMTLLFLGVIQGCWLPIYLTIHSGPDEEASRILVGTLLFVFCLAYIRLGIAARSRPFPAIIAGMALYSMTVASMILRLGLRMFNNAPDALQALVGLVVSFFILGILLNGLVAAAKLRNWSVVPA